MKRWSTLALFSFTALAAALSLTAAQTPAPPRPNVVLIISDDQGWQDYGFMGHPHIQTPALDRLAKQSLTFRRGYSPVPLCRPSLASMITGLYPHQHGVTGNDPELPDAGISAQTGRGDPRYAHYYDTMVENFHRQPNFVRDFTAQGYRTFETGKWWEGDPVKMAGFSQAMTHGEGKGNRHGDAGLEIGRQGLEPITRFIESAGTTPWLLWYAPMLPHTPHNAPAALVQKYLKVAPTEAVARYWANVEWFDQTCGELLDYLDKRGLRENTVILYVADNGWVQDPDKINIFAPRSKQSPHEGGVRSPIMVSWTGHIAPRMDDEHLATTLDFWPTLAAILNLSTPAGLPGCNLLDDAAVSHRTNVYGEALAHNVADVDHPTNSLNYRWMIDGWTKLIVPDRRNRPELPVELYDLKEDPWELRNLARENPNKVRELMGKIDLWWTPPAKANAAAGG